MTLEVGGDLETYWKSTAVASGQPSQLTLPRTSRRPNHLGSVQASPVHTANNGSGKTLTISSLHGTYIYVIVQVTRDLHPVVYGDWSLPTTEFDLCVSDVTLEQFERLAASCGRNHVEPMEPTPPGWAKSVTGSMVSLETLLTVRIYYSCQSDRANESLSYCPLVSVSYLTSPILQRVPWRSRICIN